MRFTDAALVEAYFDVLAVTNPNNGVQATGPGVASVLVNQSVISRNASGWVATVGANIFSYGNNSVNFNDSNEGNQMALVLK